MSVATYLIEFTDDELTAIYNAIEGDPRTYDFEEERHIESVLHKITPERVGDPTPAGARRASG